MLSNAHPPSPCIAVCLIDKAGRYCIGCYRNLTEIAGWGGFSATQKQTVLADLPIRRQRLSLSDTTDC